MAEQSDVPRWLYAAGAAGIFIVLAVAPNLVDKASKPVSDQIVNGIDEMQRTTTTSTTSTSTTAP